MFAVTNQLKRAEITRIMQSRKTNYNNKDQMENEFIHPPQHNVQIWEYSQSQLVRSQYLLIKKYVSKTLISISYILSKIFIERIDKFIRIVYKLPGSENTILTVK